MSEPLQYDRPASPRYFKLTIEVLETPELLDSWFWFAVERAAELGIKLTEVDRYRVFTLAASCIRRSRRPKDPVENPEGCFWRNIRHRNFFGADIDEEWAKRAIRDLDENL